MAKVILNVSKVADNSVEPPVVFTSNLVRTLVIDPPVVRPTIKVWKKGSNQPACCPTPKWEDEQCCNCSELCCIF